MKRFFLLCLILFSLPVLAVDIGAYKYYGREKLAGNLKQLYKKQLEKSPDSPLKVKVVDEIVRVWKSQELDDEWIRFDTKHFRCIIQRSNSGMDASTNRPKGYDLIRQLYEFQKGLKSAKKMKKVLFSKEEAWKYYGLVALYGQIVKSDKWGKIDDRVQDKKVKPEQIVIRIDEAKVPRERFYELYKKK